ncbi:histone-like nucleoid-structuring protein Lsr2 [Paenarthrobacter sp. 2TAF44]|uniref:histone-like nucleoid-structuring protein Lsr2 n=1 Tax=Paenarthrobacter sp. 2TAF44 TaxID=3233018 RepID=UPI003F9E65C7
MATKTIITLHDDLDGTEAHQTVSFSVEGTSYEIDLNDVHAQQLHSALAPCAAAARVVKQARKPRSPQPENEKVRAWVKENGIHVASRGAVSRKVVELFMSRS